MFVSRLHPTTTEAELIDSVNSINSDLKVHEVNCVKLVPKFDYLYSSFHIEIRVDASDMKKALDMYLSPQAWPTGVLVRRYFKPKNAITK